MTRILRAGQYPASAEPHDVWACLCAEAQAQAADQGVNARTLMDKLSGGASLHDALADRLASKLADGTLTPARLKPLFDTLFKQDHTLAQHATHDLLAFRLRDPACTSLAHVFLFYKGFIALQTQRAAHRLWNAGQTVMALFLQSRCSELWQVDIHPAARLGPGLFIDHASGVVIGETARVGHDVTLMHGVTLGGNGKDCGERHPTIGNNVLLSVGAKVLGPIHVGDGARVAAGAVVLRDVPANTTVAGIPARIVGQSPADPAAYLDHDFEI